MYFVLKTNFKMWPQEREPHVHAYVRVRATRSLCCRLLFSILHPLLKSHHAIINTNNSSAKGQHTMCVCASRDSHATISRYTHLITHRIMLILTVRSSNDRGSDNSYVGSRSEFGKLRLPRFLCFMSDFVTLLYVSYDCSFC